MLQNFINAIKTEATQNLYIFELRKFMTFLQAEQVNYLLGHDARLI
jgi:hypothetical protein